MKEPHRKGEHSHCGRGRRFGSSIVLPASYVSESVDLGYAVTAYRAQGVTTDTAHVLVEPTSTRETFYVAMTRGRHSNRAYVTLDRADDHAEPHPGDDDVRIRVLRAGLCGTDLHLYDWDDWAAATVRPASSASAGSNRSSNRSSRPAATSCCCAR